MMGLLGKGYYASRHSNFVPNDFVHEDISYILYSQLKHNGYILNKLHTHKILQKSYLTHCINLYIIKNASF
jgi:hypothetical protein